MAELARGQPHIYQQFNGLTDAKHRAIPLLEAAGLVVESAETCDPYLGEMLNRLEAPLRVARLIGLVPLELGADRASHVIALAREAFTAA